MLLCEALVTILQTSHMQNTVCLHKLNQAQQSAFQDITSLTNERWQLSDELKSQPCFLTLPSSMPTML